MKKLKYTLALTFVLISVGISAQNNSDEIIFKAIDHEIKRSINGLKIDKGQAPFFISNCISVGQVYRAKATLGALVESVDFPLNSSNPRLMVGDYSLNDENFAGGSGYNSSGGTYLSLPKGIDYLAFRRTIWSSLDRMYKSSVDTYSQKVTAIAQQNREESEKIDDYTRIEPITLLQPESVLKYDKTLWENSIKDISGIFNNYPKIQSSSVDVFFINANFYVISSEGTKIKSNSTVACFMVNASAQSNDGELIRDHVLKYALVNSQLPSIETLKEETKAMAESLQTRCSAAVIDEAYQGPVVFEGDALAELFSSKFFSGSGLYSSREPVYANGSTKAATNKMESKIGKRICAENLSIVAVPKIKTYGGASLVGSFEIDSEGVVPADSLTLVDKGILKTLLSTRIPTTKIKESNGYNRFNLNGTSQKAPGVINISYKDGKTYTDFIKTVSTECAKSGLDYYYIIRKMETANLINYMQAGNSGLTKPVAIYKVSVKTGEEKMIRTAVVSDFPMLSFKYVLGGTAEQNVYNTISGAAPVSFIIPRAMAFNDISIEKDNSPKTKLPIVESPLISKK